MTIYQTTGATPIFSLRGNGKFGNITRTGWHATRLKSAKKEKIAAALNDSDVYQVYARNGKLYKCMLNGIELPIN
jgi:hypothetical protein